MARLTGSLGTRPLMIWKLLALVVPALGSVAEAQSPARAELFTRVQGDTVRAAIRIQIDGRWHIYHDELGHPKAVGQPTTVTFTGEGIEWSKVRFPEPVKLDQSDVAGPGAFILAHEHEAVLYAAGKLAPGATLDALEVKVKGLVCEDVQGCIPFRQTMKSKGAGEDELFAKFPADLVPPSGASAAPAASATPPPEAAPKEPQGAIEKVPTEDVIEKGKADTTFYTRVEGNEVRAALEIAITPGWHLYHRELGPSTYGKPAVIQLHGKGIRWEEPRWPEPIHIDQSAIEKGLYILGHEGTIVVLARGVLEPGAKGDDVWGEISGQTCDESSCVDYRESFVSKGRGTDALWSGPKSSSAQGGDKAGRAPATAAAVSAGDEWEEDNVLGSGLVGFLLSAVFWGLFTLLMPCTYPMIPITISFFTKQADKRGGNVLPLALCYGAGIVLIFVLIGVSFGSVIIPFANHWITNLVIGLAFIYFSLTLFGLVDLQPPRFLMNFAGTASSKGGYMGVFLMGATLVVTSFTCTAPFVGTLLGSSGDRTVGEVALGMGVFGLTMALPFVMLSLVPSRIKAMPRSGEWMNTLKYSLGFVELAAALKFLSNVDVDRKLGIISRELFLIVWGVIGLLLAGYLLGAGRLLGKEVAMGAKRSIFGLLSLGAAVFFFWGLPGRDMGELMAAFLPPYSGGRFLPEWYKVEAGWPILKNDYDRARTLALEQHKLLLVNFTGEL
jgi:thiol:disulfide interchange protein